MVCRLTHSTSPVVLAAMQKLEKEQLRQIDKLKCFYKYPPVSVLDEDLHLYGVDIVEYCELFRQKNDSILQSHWKILMENAPQQREVARYFNK